MRKPPRPPQRQWEDKVVHESKTASTAQAIADELAKAPGCRRIVFETSRMAPVLFHGLSHLHLSVVRVDAQVACDPQDRSQ